MSRGPDAGRTAWFLNRARAMTPGELVARLHRNARHTCDDLAFRHSPDRWAARWAAPHDFLSSEPAREPLGFLTAERALGLSESSSTEAAALVAEADKLLEGRVKFFGYPEIQLKTPIQYGYDPHAQMEWPRRHGKQIDYRHIPNGDPKWVWELNRCQQLTVLVQAWLLSGDSRYANSALQEALRWADQNPPGRGIAWANGYEAGIRAVSLAFTHDALRGSDSLSSDQQHRLLEVLWQHGRWIERDPSSHSSANNHRLGEVVGTLTIAALAPELADAERWMHGSVEELAALADAQILVDGLGAEQAFGYTTYVTDLLLVATALLDSVGTEVPRAVLGALSRAGDALWAQIGDEEDELTYGDSDDALAIRLASGGTRGPRAVAATIASRVWNRRARMVGSASDWTAWWLFGQAGRHLLDETPPSSEPGSCCLPVGGIVILRVGETRVSLDAGPLGYLSLAAHGHADALAVTVKDAHGPTITDPGVGSYFRDPEAREAFRSTGFHATVEVDGVSQSVPAGGFLWSHHAQARLLNVDLDRNAVFAQHDGYERLADPVGHQRAVVVLADGIVLICDRLTANGSHEYALRWPLHPRLSVARATQNGFCATGDDSGELVIAVRSTAPGTSRVVRGKREPMLGWWSAGLEDVQPAWLCSWDASVTGPLLLTALVSTAQGADPSLEVDARGSRVVASTRLAGAATEITIDFEHLHVGLSAVNPVET